MIYYYDVLLQVISFKSLLYMCTVTIIVKITNEVNKRKVLSPKMLIIAGKITSLSLF